MPQRERETERERARQTEREAIQNIKGGTQCLQMIKGQHSRDKSLHARVDCVEVRRSTSNSFSPLANLLYTSVIGTDTCQYIAATRTRQNPRVRQAGDSNTIQNVDLFGFNVEENLKNIDKQQRPLRAEFVDPILDLTRQFRQAFQARNVDIFCLLTPITVLVSGQEEDSPCSLSGKTTYTVTR